MTPRSRDAAPRIDTVALDLGGVLVRVDFRKALGRIERRTGIPPRETARLLFDSGLKDLHDAGRIPVERLARPLAECSGRPVPMRWFRAVWADIFSVYPATGTLVRACRRAGHRLLLFSTTDAFHLAAIRHRWRFLDRFDGFAVSFELGVNKPDPRFFRRACRRLDVDPRRTVFLDDRAENVAAARTLGFTAIRARGAAAALRSLRSRGIVPGRP